MSAQRQQAIPRGKEVSTIPKELNSPQAKLVFHSLDAAGRGCVDDLSTRLGLKKMTLLSILKSLESQGLVERRDGEYDVVAA